MVSLVVVVSYLVAYASKDDVLNLQTRMMCVIMLANTNRSVTTSY